VVGVPDPAASEIIIGLIGVGVLTGLVLPFAWLAVRSSSGTRT
jgi:hypothetical protein